jgi:hypothetical protein
VIKVVIQTTKETYIIDKDVLWVDIFDGKHANEMVKKYGYTKDKQKSVPIPNIKKKPESYDSAAKRRMELDPIDSWTAFILERIRLFWKQFLGD